MIYRILKDKVKAIVRKRSYSQQFVPKHNPVEDEDVRILREFISSFNRIVVVTGAGVSTESGIPDYRSEEVGLYARTNHRPIKHQEFIKSAAVRQRYWARNFVGWNRFSKSRPNTVHFCVKDLEVKQNKVIGVVTQNVDNLHFEAGSRNVIELHGSGFRIICLDCDALYDRSYIQDKLLNLNGEIADVGSMIRPDGDVDIPEHVIQNFSPPFCDSCGGVLKPDITFFGDNVPKHRVELVKNLVADGDALLVLGSSLSVFSGYRIILQANELRKPIGIINIGPTRADHLATFKIQAKCGDILPRDC